jgi:uncharacterized repeat protein (TIGR01451 family)
MRLLRYLLVWFFSAAGLWAQAQTCAVPGWDGPATASGVINSYHGGSGSPAAGATSINVASIAGQRSNTRSLSAGDLILIMQMQDSATPANAGLHEYAQIVGVSGTTLQLNRALTNSYNQTMNTSNVRNWQVVYVPQYSSVTITGTVTADRWTIATGTGVGTGGIVAMDVAGSMTLNGTISVAGAGFRGGAGINGTSSRAGGTYTDANYTLTLASMNGSFKGEGIEGTPFQVFDGTVTPVGYLALLGQGYSGGAGGRGARGNAGGGGNDGDPAAGGNQYNSGGGGGSNAGAGGRGGNAWNSNTSGGARNLPAGGNTGNQAGGLGGNAVTNSVTRLIMGGGGGAGSANNSGANAVTTWPPGTSTLANGANGSIASSGASGGGAVLIRAGSISGAGVIDADGYNAHNKGNVLAESDSAGGGGAGGSIFITAGSGTGAGLTLQARGGWGGRSNYFNHGPGGGGGGGYILTNLASASTSVIPGQNGLDACCGGTNGNGSPKAYNATAGANGTAITTGGTPTGVLSGAACLPNITVGKATSTPLISAATSATAVYSISASNSGGAATNLYLFDLALPPGWTYLSSPSPSYTYSPAPPPAAASNASGAENTAAVLPAGFPVSSASSVNSATAVSLRANGAAPGVVPSAGDGTLSFGSFFLPQGGSLTVSFVVSIPDSASVGTYHNAAGAVFLDPTRLSAEARMVAPLSNNTANRNATAVGGNTAYASGATANVAGTHYSGLQAGPSNEDVRLLADLSISKAGPATAAAGGTSSYTLVGRNNGRAIASNSFSASQATDVTTSSVPATLGANPIRITDTLPSGVSLAATPTGSNWTCSGGVGSTTFSCAYFQASPETAYPLASSTALPTITAIVRFGTSSCGSASNTASISLTPSESQTANNTSSIVATSVSCSASLSVSKDNGTTSLVAGSTTQYTVTFANSGPAAADGAVALDAPSAGLSACSVLSCTASGTGVCPAAGLWPNLLTAPGLSLSTFASGASLSFVVSCGVSATGL